MYSSRIPAFVKLFLPEIICRIQPSPFMKSGDKDKKTVYLTFDDGPIPETTPYILDTLKKYGMKATFFCVGENVKKHPELYARILEEGHVTGNHTFNHLKGWDTGMDAYINNVSECAGYVSSNLFRPPYGKIRLNQYHALKKKYKLIFWDVMVPDFDVNSSAEKCLEILRRKTRPGSVLVFHDNLKAKNKLTELLPEALDFLLLQKYDVQPVTNNILK